MRPPELTGLPHEYRREASRWDRLGLWTWLPLGAGLVYLSAAVGDVLFACYWALLAIHWLVRGWARIHRPPTTWFDDRGLLVRTAPGPIHWVPRPRRVPWAQVEAIAAGGPWDAFSVAHLVGGKELRLPGVPRQVAERLAAATTA